MALTSLPVPVTTPARPPKSRIYLAGAGSIAGYGATLIALSNAWYRNYPHAPFHFFNDMNDWLQVDKAGHVFSSYTASRMNMELWGWAGLSKKKRAITGGISGAAFMTVIEILDGFSAQWGFSLGDLTANIAGSGLFVAQELAWNEQRVLVKFSFHRNNYDDPQLEHRANELFGSRTLERMLKDYNAQTYWLSANLSSFTGKTVIPRWLNLAVGYGGSGMFGGSGNVQADKGNVIFDRSDIARQRRWYLSPDIDLTRIRTKSKLLRTTFFLLNAFKFPAPAICLSGNGISCTWIQF